MKQSATLNRLKEAMIEDMGRNIKEHYGDETPDYFVMQFSILEELPEETQRRFISIIEEIENTFDLSEMPEKYQVMARGKNKNSKGGTCYITDPYLNKSPPKYRK